MFSKASATSGSMTPAMRERMKDDACSEPVATAFVHCPRATFMAAYFRAVIPEMQMPDVLTISQGVLFNSPCTMEAWPGMS
jgi:hypothetical protein